MEDAAIISRVRAESWRHAYSHILPSKLLASLDAEADVERIRNRIRERGGAYVALIDGEVVGFSTFGPSEVEAIDARLQMYSLYFVPEALGTGAAQALVAYVAEVVLALGEDRLSVWVFRDNPRARRFYEKLGATYAMEDFYEIDGVRYPDIGLIWFDLPKLIETARRERDRLSGAGRN